MMRVEDEDDFVIGEVAPDLGEEEGTITSRIREVVDEVAKKVKAPAPAKPKAERKPAAPAAAPAPKRRAVKRLSAADLIQSGYQDLGHWLVNSRVDVPVGRLMQLEAPLAGATLDELLAQTFIDRAVLQPLVRQWDRIEAAMTVVVPPLMLAAMERSPKAAVGMSGIFEMLIAQLLESIVPALEKQQEKEADLEKSLNALGLTRIPHPEHPDQLLSPVQSLILTLMSPPKEEEETV